MTGLIDLKSIEIPKGGKVSMRKLAEILGVPVRNVHKLREKGVLIREPNHTYDVSKNVRRYNENVRVAPGHEERRVELEELVADEAVNGKGTALSGTHGHDKSGSTLRKIDFEIRKLQAEVALKELDARSRSGQLVETAAVRRVWSQHISSVRNALLLLPARLAPKLISVSDVVECQTVIDEEIRRILTQLTEVKLGDLQGNKKLADVA